MVTRLNLVGKTFGRLTVIAFETPTKEGHSQFLCMCSCGNEAVCLGKYLNSGKRKTCGCANKKGPLHKAYRGGRKAVDSRSYLKHKSERDKYISEYRKLHPEKWKAYNNSRRTAKTKAGGSFTAKDWLYLCRLAKHKCLCCKKKKPLEADHVVPVSKGGTSYISNIQPLCESCNCKKHTNTTDYRTQKMLRLLSGHNVARKGL
jgi:5-methylcytosine-specific restriction endonuclease McrA